jgi:hypothetical protein
LKHCFRHKETIQSSFDLLGEMVKFNYDACKQMDTILNTESKLKKAMVMVNNNLIDSNMFIRLGNNFEYKKKISSCVLDPNLPESVTF